MNHSQASKWLRAIGGTSDVVRDADGREYVVVAVDSAMRGIVSRRMLVEGSASRQQDEAFVRACEELKLVLG